MDDQARRDDIVDRELTRVFRARALGAPEGGHLDAEDAAAWMDRSLDAARAAAIEAHVADCSDCQTLVATLARTAPEPAPDRTIGWWVRFRTPWLVPIAAAATAVAIWVAVPPPRPPSPTAAGTPRTAAEAPSPGAPLQVAPAPASPAPAGDQPQLNLERRAPTTRRSQKAVAASTDTVRAPQAGAAAVPEQPEASDALKKLEAKAETAAEPAAPAEAPAASPAAAGARERPEARSVPPSASNDAVAARRFAAVVTPLLVNAADGRARWQVTGATVAFAQRTDAPLTPARVPDNAAALVAGSAPGGTVCWLVGRAGVVLVTTDGVRFVRVTAPAVVDFTGVQASDARSATVTAVDGRRFRTSDQGATWAAVAP